MLANALTARRSSDAKIWELRRTAYGIILAKFIAIDRALDNADQIISKDKEVGLVSPSSAKYYELLGHYSACCQKNLLICLRSFFVHWIILTQL